MLNNKFIIIISRLLLLITFSFLITSCDLIIDKKVTQLACSVTLEGMPLPNAQVRYSLDNSLSQSTQTDDRGIFIIENINPKVTSEESYKVEIVSNGSRHIEEIYMSALNNYGFLNNISETDGKINYLYRMYFGEKANYLNVTMFPAKFDESVNYKIIDIDLGMEIVSSYWPGPHRLIQDKRYLIKYSLNQKFNFEEIITFRPSVADSIELNIYRLDIRTEKPCLAWSILDSNDDLIKEGIGNEIVLFNESGKLDIQVYGANSLESVYIDASKDIHVKNLIGECNLGPHRLSIEVYNTNAGWRLINKIDKTELFKNRGNDVFTNIPTGRYILIEDIEPEYNPRKLEVNMFENKRIEFDLRRYNLNIIVRPSDSNWKLSHQSKVIKTGKGTTYIEKLSPGDYQIGCFSDGDKYSFSINDKDFSYSLNCGTACLSPKIKIVLDNCTGTWELLKYNDDLFQWVKYKNGNKSSEILIGYGQYKIKYTKDEHDSYSEIYTFSPRHAECEEVFVQDCLGCNYQMEEAIGLKDNSKIIYVNEACIETFDKNRLCDQYFPVANAYSIDNDMEAALKILDDGLLRAIIESECIAFLSDNKYFWKYLLLAEKLDIDGIGGEYLLKESRSDKSNIMIILTNISENPQTKLYAYSIIMKLNQKEIEKKMEASRGASSFMLQSNKDENCSFIENLTDYHYQANRIEKNSGIESYTNIFSNFKSKLDQARRQFECN
tara:strand:+ start:80 stop:2245 length:2166 start_codon:yes stop_codon:yes gene_type:complete